jgi:hypothetical protein
MFLQRRLSKAKVWQFLLSTVSAALPHHPPKPPDKIVAKPPVGWVKLSIDGSFGTKKVQQVVA